MYSYFPYHTENALYFFHRTLNWIISYYFFILNPIDMTKIYSFFVLFLVLVSPIFAQNFHLNITAGASIGSPIGKLSEQPDGAKGSPGIMPTGGILVGYDLMDKFTLFGGIQYAHKGNKFESPSDGQYDILRAILGENFPFGLDVNYSGYVTGKFANHYLDFPIYGSLETGKKGKLKLLLGYQYSRLLKAKFEGEADVEVLFSLLKIRDLEWDESARIKKNDHAIIFGLEHEFNDVLSLGTQFNYGLTKIFNEETEDFSGLRNVFAKVLLRFRLF